MKLNMTSQKKTAQFKCFVLITDDEEADFNSFGDNEVPLLQTISTEVGLSKRDNLECSITVLGIVYSSVLQKQR